MEQYSFHQIAVEIGFRRFVEKMGGIRPGTFVCLKGYVNDRDEKADVWIQYGISYANAKVADLKRLKEYESCHGDLNIVHGFRLDAGCFNALLSARDPKGVLMEVAVNKSVGSMAVDSTAVVKAPLSMLAPTKCKKDVVTGTVSYTLKADHPAIAEAMWQIRESITGSDPKRQDGFDKLANGLYVTAEDDGLDRLHIRNCLLVGKNVDREGESKFKASSPVVAVKAAIEKEQRMARDRIREYVLTKLDYFVVEGQAILVDGVDEKLFFALPEILKENRLATVTA